MAVATGTAIFDPEDCQRAGQPASRTAPSKTAAEQKSWRARKVAIVAGSFEPGSWCRASARIGLALLFVTAPVRADWTVEPIRFTKGESSARVQGAVLRGDRTLYTIEARRGQIMSVRISSAENNAVFVLYEPGAAPETRDAILHVTGQALAGAGDGDDATHWSGRLPRSGAYLVVVGSSRGNASYRLSVEIR